MKTGNRKIENHHVIPPASLFDGCNSNAASKPKTAGAVFFITPPATSPLFL
jgi:hypothetical protein